MELESVRIARGADRYSLNNAGTFKEGDHPRGDDGKFGSGGGGKKAESKGTGGESKPKETKTGISTERTNKGKIFIVYGERPDGTSFDYRFKTEAQAKKYKAEVDGGTKKENSSKQVAVYKAKANS